MTWMTFPHQLLSLVDFRFSDPPYFLLVLSLLVGLTSGTSLVALLKQRRGSLPQNLSFSNVPWRGKLQFFTPFLGTAAGLWIFLASGLEIFGLSTLLSYAISLALTALIGAIAWSQVGGILSQGPVRS
jgi:hypothetical protein